MSRAGKRERLAIHLCACARKWPNDGRDRERWEELDHPSRDRWRFLAIRAIRFLQAEAGFELDEAPADVAGPLPPSGGPSA